MVEVDWDKVREGDMSDVNWDKVAWDEPTQSTPVEDVHEVAAAAMAHAIQQQTTAPRGGQAEQRPLPEEVKQVVQWANRHGCLEDTVPGHAEWAQREDVQVYQGPAPHWTKEQEEELLAALRRQQVNTPLLLTPGVKVVPVLPLPDSLHPGNEGAFLLDEQGDVRTLKATAHPESLHVRVGNLEIVTTGKPGPAGIPFAGNSRILVDGKPFPVKSLVLRGDVDGLWTVELEFYPRSPKE
jgi:hypothetical protein